MYLQARISSLYNSMPKLGDQEWSIDEKTFKWWFYHVSNLRHDVSWIWIGKKHRAYNGSGWRSFADEWRWSRVPVRLCQHSRSAQLEGRLTGCRPHIKHQHQHNIYILFKLSSVLTCSFDIRQRQHGRQSSHSSTWWARGLHLQIIYLKAWSLDPEARYKWIKIPHRPLLRHFRRASYGRIWRHLLQS